MGNIKPKVISDTIKDAGTLLTEVTDLLFILSDARQWVQPSSSQECLRAGGPAKYIVQSRMQLQKVNLSGFDRNYPTIDSALSNGKAEDAAAARLVDGVFKIGKFKELLTGNNFMLKTDAQRQEADKLLCVAIGDLAVFMILQFHLHQPEIIHLSVQEYCTRQGIGQDILYGTMISVLESVGQAPYGYEEASPYYDEMMGIDAGFLAECEEAGFPLNEELCKQILGGTVTLEAARGQLYEYKRTTTEVEVSGMDTLNMVERLNLG